MRLAAALPVALLGVALLPAPGPAAGPAPTPEQVDFFEKRVRPLLTEHCNRCHSAEAEAKKKLRGGLLLDSRDGLRAGGDSGAAVVPGDAAASLLVKTVRYDGEVKMPPKGKLPDAAIADLERWVDMGAPDPRVKAGGRRQVGMSLEEGRNFWAYKPPQAAAPPAVKDGRWPAGEVDRFVLAALEAKGIAPAPDADRAALARRVYFGLIGLPPTPEQIDAFAADASPDAYAKLVDRLLASPAFGERWGRHWLDVARFAESVTLRGLVFKEAWRYRDYVIDDFNRDVPFDRFVREQLAGDLLPSATVEDRRRQLIATTYLTLGNANLEEQDKKQLRMDVVDEQLDVVSKGLLAQTVTCARCHDHKFDPIPTRDYYALAGIFRNVRMLENANVSRWIEVPLPSPGVDEVAARRFDERIASLEARVKAAKASVAQAKGPAAGKGGSTVAVEDVPGVVVDDAQAMKVGEWKHSTTAKPYIGTGYVYDGDEGKGEKTITFTPDLPATGRYEVWFAYAPHTNRSAAVPVTVFSAEGEKAVTVDMKKPAPIENMYVSLGTYRFERKGQSFVLVSNEGTKGSVSADAVAFIPADEAAARMAPPSAPAVKSTPTATAAATELRRLEAELKAAQAEGAKIPRAMSVIEEKEVEEIHVHVRGNVHNLGEPAPRGFLRAASRGAAPPMPTDRSGRRELADWIASRDNPLTARVIVNRAWLWLFGEGLVRTPDNFGTTGERPTNPELLDHLAVRFADDGWSMKALVRRLVLSRTYRQAAKAASKDSPDPENRLFGRASRRRLDAECLRDAILSASGKLTAERGGPTFPNALAADYNYKGAAALTCRSVYLPMFRNSVPELLDAFDFADPSTVTGKRNASTVAPQALFLMNNPFAVEQARAAAGRVLAEELPDDASRVVRAYRLTLGRPPTDGERRVAARFLADRTGDPRVTWATLFQALFASADFRFVD